MKRMDIEDAAWRLICDLQEISKDLFDSKNLSHNNHQANTIINAGWTLFKLKFAEIPEDKLKVFFNDFEEWMLGNKWQGLGEFSDVVYDKLLKEE